MPVSDGDGNMYFPQKACPKIREREKSDGIISTKTASSNGYGAIRDGGSDPTDRFLFGGLSPPNKKCLLCAVSFAALR